MNYELAKELQEAGFPYFHFEEFCKATGCHLKDGIGRKEDVHKPTLSELIEACGEDFSGLWKKKGGWVASSRFIVDEGIANNQEWIGSTPEEAVARLWLALNKK